MCVCSLFTQVWWGRRGGGADVPEAVVDNGGESGDTFAPLSGAVQ